MEFRILGSLEVVDGDRVIALGGAKQRSLLALLLLHRSETVSLDWLVDALWGERPPATAQKTAQVYVSQLRKLLGEGRIETRGRGYTLLVAHGELDLDQFELLIERARDEEPARAATTLRQALGLFRGEPLQDLAYQPWAQTEIAPLLQLRLAAQEDRVEADLALGRHRSLVVELERLVQEQPLRERLRGQLMLALYRSGRHAEALELYREGRTALDEQLRLEPAPELRELEQRILRHDPSLAPVGQPLVERVRRNRGPLLVAGAATLLLAAAIAAGISELTGSSDGTAVLAPPNSVAVIDPRTNRVEAAIPVAGGPQKIAVFGSDVWVLHPDLRILSLLSPADRKVLGTVGVGGLPGDLVADRHGAWITDDSAPAVMLIDPYSLTVRATIKTSDPPVAIAVGPRSLWIEADRCPLPGSATKPHVGAFCATVDRIDLHTLRLVEHIHAQGARVHFDGIDFWVGSVFERLRTSMIALAAGAFWIPDISDNQLWEIDLSSRQVLGTTKVGVAPVSAAYGAGSVWVANSGDGTVSRIDPASCHVVSTIRISDGGVPAGIAGDDNGIWVTVD